MSKDLEIEQLRFRVRSLESQLAITESDLDEKRRLCVSLSAALKQHAGQENTVRNCDTKSSSVPCIGIGDPIDDTEPADTILWEKLRTEFLSALDEVNRLKDTLKSSDDCLRTERERRIRDLERMKLALREKENEISNLRNTSEAQMKRSVELEDKLAKIKPFMQPVSQAASPPGHIISCQRSQSPDINYFSRNYYPGQPAHVSGTSVALPLSHATFSSPVLISRQIVAQPVAPPYHVYRRGSN